MLEAERVKQVRRNDVQWCRGMDVWEPVFRNDMDAEGAKTVSLRWVDTDKGDVDRPNYRSRVVAREIKKAMKKSDVPSAAELFSGMPPLESVKRFALLSLFVSHNQEEAKGTRTLAIYDISRAHFHGKSVRRVFVELRDDEKERLAREKCTRSRTRWLAEKCKARWMRVLVGRRIARRS